MDPNAGPVFVFLRLTHQLLQDTAHLPPNILHPPTCVNSPVTGSNVLPDWCKCLKTDRKRILPVCQRISDCIRKRLVPTPDDIVGRSSVSFIAYVCLSICV